MSLEGVIEERRDRVGARSVSVTLGPSATPERLADTLERVRLDAEIIGKFNPIEIERAKSDRFKRAISEIARSAADALGGSDEDRSDALRGISLADDLFVDIDMDEDLVWMVLAREFRGEPLPEGARRRADELIAKNPGLEKVWSPFRGA